MSGSGRRMNKTITATAIAATALALAGCGDEKKGSASSNGSTTTKPQPSASAQQVKGKVTVAGTEFRFAPAKLEADQGKLSVTLANRGNAPHEFVLLKTGSAPG